MSNILTEKDIQEQWTKFITELVSTKREGAEALIAYLEKNTDIITAPASSKYHRNTRGGLVDHSLRVMTYLRKVNESMGAKYKDDTVVIAGLLHDLCKTNYYKITEVLDKEWKDKTDKWRKIPGYIVDEQLPLGHGEKSVIIANRFLTLTGAEMMAIRWHMSAWDAGIHFSYPSGKAYNDSADKCPLLKMLIIADLQAELYESLNPLDPVIK